MPRRVAVFVWAWFGAAVFFAAGVGRVRAADESERHWSFRPIARPALPRPRDAPWARTAVDAFVRSKLDDEELAPAPAASRLALLRRASFDLRGLPPAPAEIDAFLADQRPDAFARVVDRMLASPQYGERWGRHWLDVVRYADTGGFETDLLYAQAWRFRDYVIRSIAADKPFDRFIQEQVAGDELWPHDPDARLGSALFCIGPAVADAAMVDGQLEYEWLTDAADTTAEAFLGLTLGCARCHDHKYDPIRQRDYFGMQAVFAASDRPYPDKVRFARVKAINGLLSDAPVPKELLADPRCTIRVESERDYTLFHRAEPLAVRRLHRGELNKPQEAVEPSFPAALGGTPELSGVAPNHRRAALARWLTASDNPLVGRVLANRVWGWHFGQPLVRTPNDFGAQGEEPTHAELLDFLARELMDHGWRLSHLHRLIMLSNTYAMSSTAAPEAAEKDPDNVWLARFPRRRLEGEELRDAFLACAGTLNPKPFGKPVVPPLDRDELSGLFDAKGKWPVTTDRSEHTRRSVYLLVRRTFTYPLFSAFDPPQVMTSCARRAQTIVPAQALTLLNSPLARQQAAAFAARVLNEAGGDRRKAVARAWLLAFNRPISDPETERAVAFLGQPGGTLADLCLALFNANEFVFVD